MEDKSPIQLRSFYAISGSAVKSVQDSPDYNFRIVPDLRLPEPEDGPAREDQVPPAGVRSPRIIAQSANHWIGSAIPASLFTAVVKRTVTVVPCPN